MLEIKDFGVIPDTAFEQMYYKSYKSTGYLIIPIPFEALNNDLQEYAKNCIINQNKHNRILTLAVYVNVNFTFKEIIPTVRIWYDDNNYGSIPQFIGFNISFSDEEWEEFKRLTVLDFVSRFKCVKNKEFE